MPFIVTLMIPGVGEEVFSLAVSFSRITFPFILLWMGVRNRSHYSPRTPLFVADTLRTLLYLTGKWARSISAWKISTVKGYCLPRARVLHPWFKSVPRWIRKWHWPALVWPRLCLSLCGGIRPLRSSGSQGILRYPALRSGRLHHRHSPLRRHLGRQARIHAFLRLG